jgi:UDP-glucose:(heptosyl)LPS alpha-1,3-glucosyltransferase
VRVAAVYRNFALSGSLERDAVLAARALVALGVELHCYCNPESSDAEIPGAVFHDVRPLVRSRSRLGYPAETASFALRATRELRRDRERYDIVDVRGTAAWEHDVITVHGVAKAQQRRWADGEGRDYRARRLRGRAAPVIRPQAGATRAIERLQFRPGKFSRVVAVTEDVATDVSEVHGVPPERIHVVNLPVDLPSFRRNGTEPVRPALGIAAEAPLLLFVGSDFARKGLADAVEALGAVPEAHLVVVGGGRSGPFVRLAERIGVEARVHFIGSTSEPERYFRAADLLLLPTKEDPWGLTLIEAMAAGVPAVTTDAAGAAAVVRRANAGIVVPVGDARGFREAVAGLVDNPRLRRELAARGPAGAAPFGADAHAAALLEVYEQVLRDRGDRG